MLETSLPLTIHPFLTLQSLLTTCPNLRNRYLAVVGKVLSTTSTMFTTTFRRSLRQPLRSTLAATRPYHASTARLQKDKKSNLMDKDSINTNADEYSKSAGDATSAATEDAAFSTDKTRPEEQHDAAAREAEQQGVSGVCDVVFLLFCVYGKGTLGC